MKFKKHKICFHKVMEEYEEDKYKCEKCKKTLEELEEEKNKIYRDKMKKQIVTELIEFPIDPMEDYFMRLIFDKDI